MVYQNHRLKMVIQWKRWMATEIHLDHSSPLRKKWSPLRQVPLGNGDTSSKSEAWCVACLVEEVIMLSLLKDVMNLLLKGLDLFEQSSCMMDWDYSISARVKKSFGGDKLCYMYQG
jgi:hypothetical protein